MKSGCLVLIGTYHSYAFVSALEDFMASSFMTNYISSLLLQWLKIQVPPFSHHLLPIDNGSSWHGLFFWVSCFPSDVGIVK